MQCRKNKMSRQGRVQSDVGCFHVADFPDQNYVRVLAQNGAQAGRKSVVTFRTDLALRNAFNMILNRVFNRDDFYFRLFDFFEESVERGRFAGSGGAGDENQAVGLFQLFFDKLQVVGKNAQIFQGKRDRRWIQDSHNNRLAVRARQDGSSHFYRHIGGRGDGEPAVLRSVFDIYFHFGKQFDSAGQKFVHLFAQLRYFLQSAVYAEPDNRFFFLRFYVNIGTVQAERAGDDELQQGGNIAQ